MFLVFFHDTKTLVFTPNSRENRKVSTTSRRLALQRKSHQRQNVMKRLKRNTTRRHDLHGVPWSRGKDGFFGWLSITRGRRHVSAAFGMCINNYWKIVIVSCNKNVTLDDIRDQLGIWGNLYAILCLWFPNELPVYSTCLAHCQIVTLPLLLSWQLSIFQLPFGWKKRSKVIPCGRFFLVGPWGWRGIWLQTGMDLMVFWSNKFRFSKRVSLKTHSKVSAGNFRVKGLMGQWREFQSNLLELLAIWRASCFAMGGLPDHQPKVVQNHPLWFFSFQSHGHFFNLTLLSKKRVTHDSQMVPEKNHHQTSATFKGDFRISSRVFSSHSSVRDFPVLGCSRYGS